ncbi:hypothetical protein M0804_008827 [Polistes exclamans]|nr:hypothetical protein M0804_008827 [Polistes exclamans]
MTWQKIKTNIIEATEEALGERKCNTNAKPNNTPWFKVKVMTLTEEKSYAKLHYRRKTTTYDYYRRTRNEIRH